MIGIVICLEDRWNYTQSDRDIDIMQMYQETIKAFGVNLFLIVDKTTNGMVHKFPFDIECASYKTLDEILGRYPNYVKLYFEHPNAISVDYITLDKLVHPKDNVLYIFGGDENGLNITKLKDNEKMTSINVSNYILWSIIAMTIALYDRYVKGNN